MAGHRSFDELRKRLLRVPGAAERIAAHRRQTDEEIDGHGSDDGSSESAERPPRGNGSVARTSKRG
jgi:hypothetical protein